MRVLSSSLLIILLLCVCAPALAQDADAEQQERDDPKEHLRWFLEQRSYPFDTLKSGYRLDAYQKARAISKTRSFSQTSALAWAPIGPAPAGLYSGRVPAIAVHPTDGNTLYIGAADGGVWKTTNGGTSWVPLTDDQPSLASGCLAIDPVNPNVVYYGTGEPYNAQDAYGGAGLLKSTDGGSTWAISGLTNEKRITRIAVNPVNPDILLAATWGGIYRSTNGGASWTKTSSFSSGWDVAIDPSNPLICYAGASGVYKSTDGGITWTHLTNGIPSSTARLVLSVAPSAPSTVYVLISNTTFYKSTDAGATWSAVAVPSDLFYGGQGWYDIAIGVDPANPNHVFIGGFDPYYSTNGGSTWTGIAGMHPDIHTFAFGPGVVFMGSDGGVNRSSDGGVTFARVNNNLAITQFYSVGTNTMTPANVWGGTQDNGTLSTTGSLAWSAKFSGDGGIVNVDDRNSGLVYMELVNGVHYRSTNSGSSWTAANIGLGEGGTWITPVVLHPDSTGILYTATSKIYRSTDSASHWQATNSSFPWGGTLVRQLAVPKTSPQTLYASPGSTIYRSTDAGVTWTSVSAGLPGRTVTSIVPHRSTPSRVYATVSGSGTGHIFLSTNAGGSWASINGNFPTDLPANSVAIDPSNDLKLYVGTDLGIWSSDDGGASWAKDDGFPNSAVVMLGVTSDNYLVAATHGRSMFKAPLISGPFIAVTSPNGGENWAVGSAHSITWSQSGVANVKIEYSTNGGSAWSTIAASVSAATGSYAWTLPNTTTSQALVRVSDAANASLNDASNASFTISSAPAIAVTAPNGGESWSVASSHSITWTSSNVANVKIEYSTNTGSTWTTIIASTAAASGSYSWTVANTPSTQALVRISDASNPATADLSNAVFAITAVPTMTLSSPNGGESWIAGSSHTISWTSTLVTTAKIDYSTNNGSSWLPVTGGVAASAGSYAWTVPNTPSGQALVRISDSSNAGVADISNAVFTILPPPSIALTSPNGGETWTVLSSHPVTWTSTSITNVKIEYSTNAGAAWTLVAASTTAASGTYAWTVPNTPTTTALVRVSDASNAAVRDSSDATFAIALAPAVTVLSPNGGETWEVGSSDTVTWASASIATVKIEYTTNNGASWSAILQGAPASAGAYAWTVPNTPTTSARVRISDSTNSATNDQSNTTFTIALPTTVAVTAPNGGESWNVASLHPITWTSTNIANVKIEYSTNAGSAWNTIIASTAAASGSYPWSVANTPSSQALVRISDASNAAMSDVSNGAFTIAAVPTITLTAPDGGESWIAGSAQAITWASTMMTTVRIDYSTNSGGAWLPVAGGVSASAGSYSWTVPNTPSAQALVRVSDSSNAGTADMSNAVFTIAPPPSITLTSPNGGESWNVLSSHPVTWSSASMANAKIEYSTNSGANWTLVAASAPAASGSYSWTVPNTPTTQALVRVSDASNASVRDSSNSVFVIAAVPAVTVLSPNGGETWAVGSQDSVRWASASITSVTLEYSIDNGQNWSTIIQGIPAAPGAYVWTIPNTPSTHSRVRIKDASNSAVSDQSNAAFTIAAPTGVAVTSPNGGEVWTISSVHTITWTAGGLNNVKIKYSTNNGASWSTIVANTSASAGSYAWTVPNSPTVQGRVQVSNSNGSINDMSDGPFTISGAASATVISPNGGEEWETGSTQNIAWSSSGVASMKIDYSTDGGATWSAVAASTPDSPKAYPWVVPSAVTAQGLVRISDAANPLVGDTSNLPFKIVEPAAIALISPAGGEMIRAGILLTIAWTSSSVASVRIDYSTDNGGTWILLEPGVPAFPGTYLWTVPPEATSMALVRVSDADKFLPSDQSDTPFSILVEQFSTRLMCSDNGSEADTLLFGGAGGATDGIDTAFGESALPPAPSAGVFDVRWSIPGSIGSLTDFRDTLGAGHLQAIYTVELQPGPGGYPFTLSWGALGKGLWTLRDAATHGAAFSLRMRSLGAYLLDDPAIASLEIVHDIGTTASVSVGASWNIVSLPVAVDNPNVQSLFPGALSSAFSYSGFGYEVHDSLDGGKGYWIKFPAGQVFAITGESIGSDTISLLPGWNMVGAISEAVGVGSVTTVPPNILSNIFYGYENYSYGIADSLLPGRGYWIKSAQAGELILSSGAPASAAVPIGRMRLEEVGLNTLTVSDGEGARQTLYFGSRPAAGELTSLAFELPLAPPKGIFDVRFADQNAAEFFPRTGSLRAAYPILLQSDAYPLTVRWDVNGESGIRYVLSDGGVRRKIGPVVLSGKGELLIRDPKTTKLILQVERKEK